MVRVRVSLIQRLNRLRNFIINPRVHTLRIYDSANFFFFFLFHSLNPEGIRGTIDTTCIKRVGTTMTRHVAYRERFSQIEKPPGEDAAKRNSKASQAELKNVSGVAETNVFQRGEPRPGNSVSRRSVVGHGIQ